MAKTAHTVQDEAEQMVEKADWKRGAYLRDHGWQYTSETPNCYWMWCKVWCGKQWTYHDAEAALRAEAWMAEMGEDAAGMSAEGWEAKSEPSLSEINELAKTYASSYASPHHITFTVEGLRNLIAASPKAGEDLRSTLTNVQRVLEAAGHDGNDDDAACKALRLIAALGLERVESTPPNDPANGEPMFREASRDCTYCHGHCPSPEGCERAERLAAGVDGKTPDQLRQELLSGQWDLSKAAEKPDGVEEGGNGR